jgi:hypothetical protein
MGLPEKKTNLIQGPGGGKKMREKNSASVVLRRKNFTTARARCGPEFTSKEHSF